MPLDYCNLGGDQRTIDIAVIKMPALSTSKLGTIFLNFGKQFHALIGPLKIMHVSDVQNNAQLKEERQCPKYT